MAEDLLSVAPLVYSLAVKDPAVFHTNQDGLLGIEVESPEFGVDARETRAPTTPQARFRYDTT